MKHILHILIALVYFQTNIFGQTTTRLNYEEIDYLPIHFGFVLGFNSCDFTAVMAQDSIYANVESLVPGFHVGIISNLRLNNYMDFRFLPGMSFGSRDISYTRVNGETELDESPQKLPFYPLEFPFVLKLKSERINNYRPYIIGDITFRYDMSGSKKTNLDGDDKNKSRVIRIKPFDYYYGVGLGIDYYFEFFKLSTEIKFAFGQRDVLNHEPNSSGFPEYTNYISSLKSNIIFLSFHFE